MLGRDVGGTKSPTIVLVRDRRGHVDDSSQKLGMFEIWQKLPTAEELVATQTVAIAQRRGDDWGGHGIAISRAINSEIAHGWRVGDFGVHPVSIWN